MSEMITFRLEIFPADLEMEQAAAQESSELTIEKVEASTRLPETGLGEALFVEPVSVIAIATLALLATRMVDHWLAGREQGVLLDLREDPPVISRIAGVPQGFLVVIDQNGQATTHKGDYRKGEDIIPLLTDLLT